MLFSLAFVVSGKEASDLSFFTANTCEITSKYRTELQKNGIIK